MVYFDSTFHAGTASADATFDSGQTTASQTATQNFNASFNSAPPASNSAVLTGIGDPQVLFGVEMDANGALEVLDRDFDVFDTAKQQDASKADGDVSRNDLNAVANSNTYTNEQRAAAKYLLDNDQVFVRLDTANGGATRNPPDGIISRTDVTHAVNEQPIWADTSIFSSDGALIPRDVVGDIGPNATPQESAAYIIEIREQHIGGSTDEIANQFFVDALAAHQGDAQWTADFYASLGAEHSADLISNSTSPAGYNQYQSSAQVEQQIDTVRLSLQSLHDNNALTGADMDRLIHHWALDSGEFNAGVADLFAGMPTLGYQDLKNEFVTSALDMSNANIDRLADHDRTSLSAAAAHVLAATGHDNQIAVMASLNESGTLAPFIERAMSIGTTQVSASAHLDEFEMQVFPTIADDRASPRIIAYDGVTSLISNAATAVDPQSNAMGYLGSSYTSAEARGVVATLFDASMDGLRSNDHIWSGNVRFEDASARLFTNGFDGLIESDLYNGGGNDIDFTDGFGSDVATFSRYVVFSEPAGTNREAVSEFLSNTLVDWVDAVNEGESVALVNETLGHDDGQLATVTGELMGHVSVGMLEAVGDSHATRAAQENALEFWIDLGFSFAPGVGKVGNHVIDTLVSELSTNLQSEVKDLVGQELKDALLEELPGFDDSTLSSLYSALKQDISGAGLNDFRDGFEDALTQHQIAGELKGG